MAKLTIEQRIVTDKALEVLDHFGVAVRPTTWERTLDLWLSGERTGSAELPQNDLAALYLWQLAAVITADGLISLD